jgi:hypothetical protein
MAPTMAVLTLTEPVTLKLRGRSQETFSYRSMLIDYMKSGAKWISARKPMLLDSLFDVDQSKATPRNDEPALLDTSISSRSLLPHSGRESRLDALHGGRPRLHGVYIPMSV